MTNIWPTTAKPGIRKLSVSAGKLSPVAKTAAVFPWSWPLMKCSWMANAFFLGTIRDISERKQAEKEIRDYIKKLQISNQELDQFAYIASHDLKEPLRGLANNAMFLQEDYEAVLDQDGNRRLNRMRFLCSRMEQLVDSLLYYSRLGRQELAIESKDLNQVINKVKELTIPEESEANVQVHIPQVLPVVTCDVPRITELFRNLISNAIKYNQSSTKQIEVGVTQATNPLTDNVESPVFYVKDNGIGIEPRFFEDIFRIFKRLNEEDDAVRGTGVGLTFVKKIIERHNGDIWLESIPGEGSCFYFTLKMGS